MSKVLLYEYNVKKARKPKKKGTL